MAPTPPTDKGMPGQVVLTPKNPMPRRGGFRVSRTGREESRPLSDPRQIAVRASAVSRSVSGFRPATGSDRRTVDPKTPSIQ
jgi:hypothetical protein